MTDIESNIILLNELYNELVDVIASNQTVIKFSSFTPNSRGIISLNKIDEEFIKPYITKTNIQETFDNPKNVKIILNLNNYFGSIYNNPLIFNCNETIVKQNNSNARIYDELLSLNLTQISINYTSNILPFIQFNSNFLTILPQYRSNCNYSFDVTATDYNGNTSEAFTFIIHERMAPKIEINTLFISITNLLNDDYILNYSLYFNNPFLDNTQVFYYLSNTTTTPFSNSDLYNITTVGNNNIIFTPYIRGINYNLIIIPYTIYNIQNESYLTVNVQENHAPLINISNYNMIIDNKQYIYHIATNVVLHSIDLNHFFPSSHYSNLLTYNIVQRLLYKKNIGIQFDYTIPIDFLNYALNIKYVIYPDEGEKVIPDIYAILDNNENNIITSNHNIYDYSKYFIIANNSAITSLQYNVNNFSCNILFNENSFDYSNNISITNNFLSVSNITAQYFPAKFVIEPFYYENIRILNDNKFLVIQKLETIYSNISIQDTIFTYNPNINNYNSKIDRWETCNNCNNLEITNCNIEINPNYRDLNYYIIFSGYDTCNEKILAIELKINEIASIQRTDKKFININNPGWIYSTESGWFSCNISFNLSEYYTNNTSASTITYNITCNNIENIQNFGIHKTHCNLLTNLNNSIFEICPDYRNITYKIFIEAYIEGWNNIILTDFFQVTESALPQITIDTSVNNVYRTLVNVFPCECNIDIINYYNTINYPFFTSDYIRYTIARDEYPIYYSNMNDQFKLKTYLTGNNYTITVSIYDCNSILESSNNEIKFNISEMPNLITMISNSKYSILNLNRQNVTCNILQNYEAYFKVVNLERFIYYTIDSTCNIDCNITANKLNFRFLIDIRGYRFSTTVTPHYSNFIHQGTPITIIYSCSYI